MVLTPPHASARGAIGSELEQLDCSITRPQATRLGAACTYVELPGIGHLPMDEDPQGFVAAIEPFIAKVLHRQRGGVSAPAVTAAQEAAPVVAVQSDAVPSAQEAVESTVKSVL